MTTKVPPALNNFQSLNDYVSKNKFAESEDCPVNNSELNWIFKQRAHNGFAEAFVKVTSRNYLIHVPSFINCLHAKRGS